MNFDARIGNESSLSGAYWQPTDSVANLSQSTCGPAANTPLIPGDGQFSSDTAGTQPQKQLDLQLAQMANDSYTLTNAEGVTGTQSEKELIDAGWTRLEPAGDHLVDGNGNQIAIDPKMLEDSTSGFRASIYQNGEGQYVVAYAGTDPSEMPDIASDAQQAFGLQDTQYNMAINLAKKAEVAFGEGNVVYTGHSLGGGLASTAALSVGATAVTFNSAGPSNDTLRDLGFSPNQIRSELENSGQVRHYIVDGDPLNLAQKDIPALPLPLIGVISPPDPVGHPLRIELPDGMKPVIDSHGGGGDGTSYVEALRENSPYASGSNNDLLPNILGNYGDFRLNTLGSIIETGVDAVKDVAGIAKDTASDIRDTLGSDASVIEKTTGVFGDLSNGIIDSNGAVAGHLIDGAGDVVQDVTDFAGNMVRDVGRELGLSGPANFLARGIEGTGELVNTVADAAGGAVDWVSDKLGDGVEIVADVGGKVVQFGVDTAVAVGEAAVDGAVIVANAAVDVAEFVGNVVVETSQVVGNAVVDTAKFVGNVAVDTAKAVGNAVVDTTKAVGNAISDGAKAVGDAASWVGDKLKFW